VFVYDEKQRLTGQIAPKIFREQRVMALPEFFRETGSVRSDDQVFERPQGRLGRQRLPLEDIECRARNAMGTKRIGECGLVHLRAAGPR
jgi:hypothetical protein